MATRRSIARIAAVCAWLGFAIAAGAAPDRPSNIVVLVADDLRADVMSVYGGPVKTLNLEKLAARGVLFRRATCGYPICHVSRAEMLTGRMLVAEAARTGGRLVPFDQSWTLWPQALRNAGWRTMHFGKWHVAGTPADCGYSATSANFVSTGRADQTLTLPLSATERRVTGYVGWMFHSPEGKPQPEFGVGLTPQTDARIADAAVEAIGRGSDRPLFLHVNFTAPHDPLHWPDGRRDRYPVDDIRLPRNVRASHPFDQGTLAGRDELIVPAPRSDQDIRRERSVYYAIVENLDQQVGRILAAIEGSSEPDSWLVIFTSDQGLALGSHGLMGKQNQYEHTVNTPLIMAGPDISRGRRVDDQCALRDLYPTICELAGVEIPSSVQGRSLMPVLRGDGETGDEPIVGYFADTQRMIRTADGWKLIWYPRIDRVQLFHTLRDPEELDDLSQNREHRGRREQLMLRLKSWLNERGDPGR